MERYTLQQRFEIIKLFYQNQCSYVNTERNLRRIHGRHYSVNRLTIRRIVDNFESEFSLHDKRVPVRQRNARTQENIDAVAASVRDNPNLSIPRRSQQLNLSQTTTWRILRKDLGLHPYKIQLVQELKPLDHHKRRLFADFALEQLENDEHFYRKILFSDEAHFWLNGYVNKQNCRIWSDENPHEILQTTLHPDKVTVWCAIHAGGVIGPYFFELGGRRVTVDGERYRTMLTEFFFPAVVENNLEDMWFQQDGATCHTATLTIDLLKTRFGDKIISRNCPVNYPPRSCDLTPCDFFLWGYVKSQVYADNPTTIEQLKINIERAIGEIQPNLCEKVMENWTNRMRYVRRSRGAHLNDVIFHT